MCFEVKTISLLFEIESDIFLFKNRHIGNDNWEVVCDGVSVCFVLVFREKYKTYLFKSRIWLGGDSEVQDGRSAFGYRVSSSMLRKRTEEEGIRRDERCKTRL